MLITSGYWALKKLHSKPAASRVSVIQAAYGCIVPDMDGKRACLAEYLEQLYMVVLGYRYRMLFTH